MRSIECLLWENNVTLGEPGVGLIPLIQDYYSVLGVLLGKVHLEIRP